MRALKERPHTGTGGVMREYEQEVREQYEIEIKCTRRTRGAFFCIGNADTEVFLMKETLASEKRAALALSDIEPA